jgi:hypothetical protein
MAWKIDPQVLEDLRTKAPLSVDFFKKIFGVNTSRLTYPYSLTAKLAPSDDAQGGTGISADDFAGNIAFGADLDLVGGTLADTTGGVFTGWEDITSHDAVANTTSPEAAALNYIAIMAATKVAFFGDEAGTGPARSGSGVVWFPHTGISQYCIYHIACPSAGDNYRGLTIYPGLTYKAAPNVILMRYDACSTSIDEAMFTTRPISGLAAAFGDSTTVFDGLTIMGQGQGGGSQSGIIFDNANGGAASTPDVLIVRNCRFHDMNSTTGNVRYGVYSLGAQMTIIRSCKTFACEYSFEVQSGMRIVDDCYIDMTRVSGRSSSDNNRGIHLGSNATAQAAPLCLAHGNHVVGKTRSTSYQANAIGIWAEQGATTHMTVMNNIVELGVAVSGSNVIGVSADSTHGKTAIVGNKILPKMADAAADMATGIYGISQYGLNCIVGNTISVDTHGPYKLNVGIDTKVNDVNSGNQGNCRVLDNIVSGDATQIGTPFRTGQRCSNPTGNQSDAKADLTQYDYAMSNVCAHKTITNEDGKTKDSWSVMGHGLSAYVNTLHSSGGDNPTLYAGGTFTNSGSQTVGRIAKWTGSGWKCWHGTGFPNGEVKAILTRGTQTWVGGSFTGLGMGMAVACGQLVYSVDGGNTIINPVINYPNQSYVLQGVQTAAGAAGYVTSIIEWNGKVVVAGRFQKIVWTNGASRWCNNIFAFDPESGLLDLMGASGSAQATNGPGLTDSDYITSLASNGNGELLIVGHLLNIGQWSKEPLPYTYGWHMARYSNDNDANGNSLGWAFRPLSSVVFPPGVVMNKVVSIHGDTILVGGNNYQNLVVKSSGTNLYERRTNKSSVLAFSRNPQVGNQGTGDPDTDIQILDPLHGDVFFPQRVSGLPPVVVYDIWTAGGKISPGDSQGIGDRLQATALVAHSKGMGTISVDMPLAAWGDRRWPYVISYTDEPLGSFQRGGQFEITALCRYKNTLVIGGDFGEGTRSGVDPYTYSQEAYGKPMNIVGSR